MAFDINQAKTKFASLISQIPITVTYDTADLIATRTVLMAERAHELYGDDLTYKFSILIGTENFATRPECGDIFTVSGTSYRALRVEEDAAGIGLTIDLGERYA